MRQISSLDTIEKYKKLRGMIKSFKECYVCKAPENFCELPFGYI